MTNFPERIICITEEAVEFLFAIGEGHRVVGVSAYVKRPIEATKLPKVSAFVNGSIKKIKALDPDLILGFSDIQKDFARDLIGEGLNVFIANHRSIDGIIDYLSLIGNMVGKPLETEEYISTLKDKISYAKDFAKNLERRPKVYIEEWDEPKITGIEWFSEIVELCGLENVFKEKSLMSMANERYVTDEEILRNDPDIILACWCGKPVELDSFKARKDYQQIKAVKNEMIFELEPEIFLQPGPAPIVDGIDYLIDHVWKKFKLKSSAL